MPFKGDLTNALDNILNRFPDARIIDALMADAGLGYRPYSIVAYDCEIVEARKQLVALREKVATLEAEVDGLEDELSYTRSEVIFYRDRDRE